MANEKDIEKANEGAPAVDIPDLKKKDKERKKAGFGWGGAKPGASPFSGATGGSGAGVARAAASAANAAGGAAAGAAAGAAGGGSSVLAGLLATTLGKALVALGAVVFLGGAGLVGYAMLKGGGGATGYGDLGGLASSLKVRKGGNDSTGWLASKGEIAFDPVKAKQEADKKAAEAAKDQTAGAPAPEQTADAAGQAPGWKQDRLDHNLSGAKLSSSLGGAFGAKNIFGGSGGGGVAPKFNDSLGKISIPGSQRGKLSASRASSVRSRVGQRVSGPRLASNKAFGQLRIAKGMSALGAGASGADEARSHAASAFDGATGQNALEAGGPGGGMPSGAVDSPSGSGGGAPDITAPNVDTPNAIAVNDDTTAMLAAIGAMANQAGKLMQMGTMLMVLGAALSIIARALIGGWFTTPLGIALQLIAVGLIAAGLAMQQIGKGMADMAKQMGSALAARTGDIAQQALVNECTDQALEGTNVNDCRVGEDLSHREHMQTIEQDGERRHRENEQTNNQVLQQGPTP